MYNAKNYTEQGGSVTHIGGKLMFEAGAEMDGAPLQIATADTVGAVKPGTGLSVDSSGTITIVPAANQTASTATDVAGIVADFNGLLTKLKMAGFVDADMT